MSRSRRTKRGRRVCFVTGTRAEWGLMLPVLRAIRATPTLRLQVIATGMHLDAAHGRSIDRLRADGFRPDAVVPWPAARAAGKSAGVALARQTGRAMAGIADALHKLSADIVLVVGDRVEAFAAAAAAHVSGLPVAHVHGGDRALGQIDDSLRHAITKLSHIHFAATASAEKRLRRLGEDPWRIILSGSPAVDGIRTTAAGWHTVLREFPLLRRGRYAMLVLHPTEGDLAAELRRAAMLLRQTLACPFDRIIAIYPNNDPGSAGIVRALRQASGDPRLIIRRDISRALYLGLLRDAAVLVGNSSSGLIEAGSFGTPVLDVGPRQEGREHGPNVMRVPFKPRAIASALAGLSDGRHRRASNTYGDGRAAWRIVATLRRMPFDNAPPRKLIAY